jgi:hypothetical protein
MYQSGVIPPPSVFILACVLLVLTSTSQALSLAPLAARSVTGVTNTRAHICCPDQWTSRVFYEASTLQQLTNIVKSAPALYTPMVELIVAPDPPSYLLHSSTGTPHLQLNQFRTVIHALCEMGDIPMPSDEVPTPDQLDDLVYDIPVRDGMVPGSKWTHRQLKHLNFWSG